MTDKLYVVTSTDGAGTWYALVDLCGFNGWTRKKARAAWLSQEDAKGLAANIARRFPTRWDVKVAEA